MEIIVEMLVAFIVFIAINYGSWSLFEKTQWPPKFLDYQPFCCRKCLTFWLAIGVAVTAFLLGFNIGAITLAILSVLNAVAMTIDQRRKTITLDEYEKIHGK